MERADGQMDMHLELIENGIVPAREGGVMAGAVSGWQMGQELEVRARGCVEQGGGTCASSGCGAVKQLTP